MKRNNSPLISIILVNWNGRKWLPDCLESIFLQTYSNFEVILVDNASEDDSVEFVRTNYPGAIILKNNENAGFAGGNNRGYEAAKGEYLFLLNTDTRLESDSLEKTLKAFDLYPNAGTVQPKLVMMNNPEILDACGSYWTDTTILHHYGMHKKSNHKAYNSPIFVFSNKGAAMLIRKQVIDSIGLFDDDYWCYYEETDLCHRIWISGYECLYYPDAVIHHAVGSTAKLFPNAFINYHSFKNKLNSFLKNFELKTLIRVLPVHFIAVIMLCIVWLFKGKIEHSTAMMKSVMWNLTRLPDTFKKRRKIQLRRRMLDTEIFKITKKNPGLKYYWELFTAYESGSSDVKKTSNE